jgi:hypothetical protein
VGFQGSVFSYKLRLEIYVEGRRVFEHLNILIIEFMSPMEIISSIRI